MQFLSMYLLIGLSVGVGFFCALTEEADHDRIGVSILAGLQWPMVIGVMTYDAASEALEERRESDQ